MGGLQIWIDVEGKKSKHTGILYPMGVPPQQAQRQMHQPGSQLTNKQRKQEFLLFTKEMILSGFLDSLNGTRFANGSNSGIQAAIKLDSAGILNYEIKIPFSAFSSDIRESKTISVGYEIKGLNTGEGGEHREVGSNRGGMEGGGGFGGEHRGGAPGGGRNPQHPSEFEGGSDMNTHHGITSESQSFWHKTVISSKIQ